jgi:hypothetical protein
MLDVFGKSQSEQKKLVSSPTLTESLSSFLGMGDDCRRRRARWEKFFLIARAMLGQQTHVDAPVQETFDQYWEDDHPDVCTGASSQKHEEQKHEHYR